MYRLPDGTADSGKVTWMFEALKRFLKEQPQPPTESDVPKADPYLALREVEFLGHGSQNGVNRTDDPSRGPIE